MTQIKHLQTHKEHFVRIIKTFQSNELKVKNTPSCKTHTHPATPELLHAHTNTVPVLQIWHGEVPADEAHLQADDLSVFGRGRAAVFGRPGVLAAAVAGRLRADAVPRQVGHQGRLLEERRNLADVFH